VRRERTCKPFTAKPSPFNQLPSTVRSHQVPELFYAPFDLSSSPKELARKASNDPIQLQKWEELYSGSKYGHVAGPESQIRIVRVKDPFNRHLQAFLAEDYLAIETLYTEEGGKGKVVYFRFPAYVENPRDSRLAKKLGLHVQSDGEIVETPSPFKTESQSCQFENPEASIAEIPDLLLQIFIYQLKKGRAA
jgi:hypothetical protein